MGDLSLYALNQIISSERAPFAFAIILGLSLPTGKTNTVDTTGTAFSTADQPGNGGFSASSGVVLSKQLHVLELSFNLLYTQNTKGCQATVLGSLWNYNIAAVYEFYKQAKTKHSFDAILELNGAIAAENRMYGVNDLNSGGDSLFLLTGIRENYKSGTSLYFGLSYPLLERYHGAQVSTRYGLIGGIDFSFG